MRSFRFKVIDACYQDAKNIDAGDVDFFLEMDKWDDYGYQTTYHLHATRNITKSKTLYLGQIQIMRLGQGKHVYTLPKGDIFNALNSDFVSISCSVDLFKSLSRLLPDANERGQWAQSLRLITSDKQFNKINGLNDECFDNSLMRNYDQESLQRCQQYLTIDGAAYDLTKQCFEVSISGANTIYLDFTTPDVVKDLEDYPSGVIAFVGHNASGKSTTLYRIARALYSSPKVRDYYRPLITIQPDNIGIEKLILFSYSAFDNFRMPGLTKPDYQQMLSGLESGFGRFLYCGMRNPMDKGELDALLEDLPSQLLGDDVLLLRKLVEKDRQPQTSLHSSEEFANSFLVALETVLSNNRKQGIWSGIIEDCEKELPSLYPVLSAFTLDYWGNPDYLNKFSNCSTGVKVFLHSIVSLIAYIENNSLLMFDEPENYLHPPLLSFLMKWFRRVAKQHDSVLLLATHSPVVIQELLSKNIYIVDRDGEHLCISHPEHETYGESFEFVNNMVFRLTTDNRQYPLSLDAIYERFHCGELDDDGAISAIENALGFQLSAQMESMVLNLKQEGM